jgi:CRP/FNR family transcriptional regulator
MKHPSNVVPIDSRLRRSLADCELEALFSFHRVHQARPHTLLFQEGDVCHQIYRVVSGVATRTRHLPDGTRHLTGLTEPGDILGFGPGALHYDETVEAVFEFEYQAITLDGLGNRLADHPALSMALCTTLHRQGRRIEDLFMQRVHMPAYKILARFLIKLRQLVGEGPDRRLHVPVRRSDIADHLGFTSETASRAFTRLRKMGLIETLPGRDLKILDLGGLMRLASAE